MELATSQPASRAPAARYAWWLVPVGTAVGTALAGSAGPADARIAVIAAGTVATAATAQSAGLLLRRRRLRRSMADSEANAAAAREEVHRLAAERQQQSARQREVLARLSKEWLPAAVQRLRHGDVIDDILAGFPQDPREAGEFTREIRAVLRTALRDLEEEFDRGTSAEQSVVSIGSRMQVYTTKIRGLLHEMQQAHGSRPAVAQGLMELDEEIGPADCLAASIVVLGGSDRPARQWQDPQRLLSVVRGGMGRIKEYRRVDVRRLPDLAVDGGLVDHLTIILAHLLDNATRYSPPTERVVVTGREVPNGVAIEVQDAGKGMNEEKKAQAEQSLQGVAAGAGLGGLTEDAHLGLRVVGRLARKYGISVAFDDSPWQGTSVVVVVPHKYFSPVAAEAGPVVNAPVPAAPTARAASAAPVAMAVEAPRADDTTPATTAGGLPKRRSRNREKPGSPAYAPAGTSVESAVPPAESFRGLADFAASTRERTAPPPQTEERPGHSESN